MSDKSANKGCVKGAALLAAAGVVAKLIGGIYRIPLTNLLGAEGMGYYQLVFPVYALLVAVISTGMPVLISRIVGASGDKYGYAVFRKALSVLAIAGLASSLILALLAKPLSAVQGEEQATFGYIIIAPALFFVAIMSVFKGWFNGHLDMKPSAFTSLSEQVIKLGAGLAAAYLLRSRGTAVMAIGALAAVTLSEGVSLLAVVVYYGAKGGRFPKPSVEIPFRVLFQSSAPLTLSGVIFPLVTFVDSLIMVRLIALNGTSDNEALSAYGLLTGAVGSIVGFPVVLTVALAAAIIPVISRKLAERDSDGIRQNGFLALKLALSVSLPLALGLICVSPQICDAFYPSLSAAQRELAAKLLSVSSVGIPLLALLQIYNSMLQAVGGSSASARNLAIAGGVKILSDVALVPFFGIMGGAVATVLCYAVGLTLSVISYGKLTGSSKSLIKNVAEITGAGVIMSAAVICVRVFIGNAYLALAAAVAAGAAVYCTLILLFKVFTKDELSLMPLSGLTLRLSGYKEDV